MISSAVIIVHSVIECHSYLVCNSPWRYDFEVVMGFQVNVFRLQKVECPMTKVCDGGPHAPGAVRHRGLFLLFHQVSLRDSDTCGNNNCGPRTVMSVGSSQVLLAVHG